MKYSSELSDKIHNFQLELYDGSIDIAMTGVGGTPKFSIKDYPLSYPYVIAYGKNLIDSTDCLIIFMEHHNKTIKEQKKHIKEYIKSKDGIK